MVRFRDISIFFTSKCCNNGDGPLSEPSPKNSVDHVRQYFDLLLKYNPNIHLFGTTITIGNKYYGKMSSKKQYENIYKAIKKHCLYHSDDIYFYTFEYTSNGVVHAHGITTVYQNVFEENFYKFGKMNIHKNAYQKIEHFDEYFKYIIKDINNDNPGSPVHNITNKKLTELRGRVRELCE